MARPSPAGGSATQPGGRPPLHPGGETVAGWRVRDAAGRPAPAAPWRRDRRRLEGPRRSLAAGPRCTLAARPSPVAGGFSRPARPSLERGRLLTGRPRRSAGREPPRKEPAGPPGPRAAPGRDRARARAARQAPTAGRAGRPARGARPGPARSAGTRGRDPPKGRGRGAWQGRCGSARRAAPRPARQPGGRSPAACSSSARLLSPPRAGAASPAARPDPRSRPA